MLEILESLGVKEVKQFKKRSSTVLRDLLLTNGNQIKKVLLDKIRKVPFFRLLTDEVTYISNIQIHETFIKYYDHERGEAHIAFIDSNDFFNFSDINSADPQTIHFCLISMISNLQLELSNLKAFSSDITYGLTSSEVATKLKKKQNLKSIIECSLFI